MINESLATVMKSTIHNLSVLSIIGGFVAGPLSLSFQRSFADCKTQVSTTASYVFCKR